MTSKPASLAELNRGSSSDWCVGEEISARHSSLAIIRAYDAGCGKQKFDSIYYVKTLLFLSIVYLIWVGFHESLHYASCSFPGNRAYLASLLPTPTVACIGGDALTPYGAFIYYMAPYIVAIIVMAVFCRAQSSLLRLVPYTAFFDLQYNLLATSLLGGRLNGRENDVFSLMQQLEKSDPLTGLYNNLYAVSVAFLIGLSLIVFYYGYGDDLSDPRNRNLFIAVFLFYTFFYVAGTIALFY